MTMGSFARSRVSILHLETRRRGISCGIATSLAKLYDACDTLSVDFSGKH